MEESRKKHLGEKTRERPALLSSSEKFAFITSLVGLVADAIALVTFVAGFWNFQESDEGKSYFLIFIIISGLVLIYGWLLSSWVIVKRKLRESGGVSKNYIGAIRDATVGIGLILIPVCFIWFVTYYGGDLTAHLPLSSNPNDNPLINRIIGIVSLYLLAGSAVFLSQYLIMPLIYQGIDNSASADDIQRIKLDLEKNWKNWEKRISCELGRYNWVTVNKLQDMAEQLDVPLDCIELVFAKYAALHPRKGKFGYLKTTEDDYVSENRVLVSSEYDMDGMILE